MNIVMIIAAWIAVSIPVGLVVGKMIRVGSMNDEDGPFKHGERTMDLKEQHEKECKKFEEAQQRFYQASADRSIAERDLYQSTERLKKLENQLQEDL